MSYTRVYPWQILTRLAGLTLSYRLPLTYDAEKLRQDMCRVLAHFAPVRHFREDHHDGGWEAIGLVASAGDPRQLGPRHLKGADEYAKTPALAYAPYIEALLDALPCEKRRVRFMRMTAGTNIFWHFDSTQHMDGEVARLHIPVATNPHVAFQISHEAMRWESGEFWYGDFSFPHRLCNGGTDDRIHLVMDLKIDDFLRATIPPRMARQTKRRKRVRRVAQRLCRRYTQYAPYMPDRLRAGIGQAPRAIATASASRGTHLLTRPPKR